MAIRDQWKTIKNNWLIIVVILAIFIFMNIGGFGNVSYSTKNSISQNFGEASYDSDGYAGSRSPLPSSGTNFAPEVTERKITRSASLSTEVENGQFDSAQQSLKSILSSSGSYILNENVNRYGADKRAYYQGSYDIRVDTAKYDALISELKGIGEVKSFSESAKDVTGQYTNAEINLEIEKARLQRYLKMYDEAKDIGDKLNINDRIFDQERTIKYLEDSIRNIDERIEYTTVHVSLTEKRSGYADVILVKFSSLIENLVDSFNALLVFIFTVLPWAVLVLIVGFIWKLVRKKTK